MAPASADGISAKRAADRRPPAGSPSAAQPTPAMSGEGGTSVFFPRRALVGALIIIALAVVAGIVASGGAHGRTAASPARYGGLPSWLLKATVPVGRIVHASPTRSVLAIEGDTVDVGLSGAGTFATLVGPSVPETGKFPVPATSPCTFVITFAKTSGVVPIRAGDFTIADEEGRLHHPKVTGLGSGRLPGRLTSGKSVSLKLYAVLPTGSGSLSWAPVAGRPLVSWDFDVEID
jgi:hypothetical protein